ncbi:hypothetical protein EUZ85_29515 [Hahella sp. KA22]|uniref:hypothetical protein n=1 Tax=Hahella sp. KA22 TaxID=1628392 RepID=UPI000FDE4C98|nr:hypothetical protein [Hahella sp. KA22]AZZ94632.1 hypothetical protein ENC22_26930 [Hahella sp. KA22]QAY58005.1 hypothetical protein EUZ85_29515 [Hahella sp. KA22]
MRWIFISLLMLNGLVFAVQWLELQKREGLEEVRNRAALSETGANLLTLLSEVDVREEKVVVEPGVEKAPETPVSKGEKLCLLMGPFEEDALAQGLRMALAKRSVESVAFPKDISLAPEYWVYLEPMESRKTAIIKLRELQVRKIDSYLISQGELRNGISLGLFKNVDSANRLLKQRISEGYDAKIKEVPKGRLEYWVATKDEVNLQTMARVDKVLDEKNVKTNKRQIFCKSVASGVELP